MEPNGEDVKQHRPRDVDDDILVEAPMMRSVAIAGSTSTPGLFRVSSFAKPPGISLPPLKKVLVQGHGLGKPASLSFGKPSALGIPRPSSISKRQISDGLFGVEREWSGVSTGSWDVKSEDLEMVPTDFPLERTHREINDDSSVVAKRIADTLRSLSVEAEYCCKKAKAKCKTMDLVSFRIRLFTASETGQPVVVELQRRNGSASSFMRTCRAILDAAEGKLYGSVSRQRVLPPTMKPVGGLKCLEHVRVEPTGKEGLLALEGALNQFRSEAPDLTSMGLENLVYLTDESKTSHMDAMQVSMAILKNEDTREDLRHVVEHDSFEGDRSEIAQIKQKEHQRCLAFTVFANALFICCADGSLSPLISSEDWFCTSLIPSLVDELDRVDSSVITAYQSARCLHSCLKSSEEVLQLLRSNGGKDALEKAKAAGSASHDMLAEETERCLSMFQYFA